jgi:glucosamine--fructose-6-phosphate aminotransferase (isomerizing)
MYLLAVGLAYILGNVTNLINELTKLPDMLETLFDNYSHLPKVWADPQKFNKIFFLGNGPNYGLACEAMLKVKEMSLSWVEAYHVLEFRHGPMSLVDNKTLVVGFISQLLQEPELAVLRDLQQLGARVILCNSGYIKDLSFTPLNHLYLEEKTNDWLFGILYLTLMQSFGYHLAINKGQNPDQPKNLSQVIEI